MSIELRVPSAGESITKVQIGAWRKREGEAVAKDEALVELETDKATMELPSPQAGVMGKILKKEGETAQVGDLIGYLEEAAVGAAAPAAKEAQPQAAKQGVPADGGAKAVPVAQVAGSGAAQPVSAPSAARTAAGSSAGSAHVMPAAQRVLAERGLRPEEVPPTGPGGRLLKEDVLRHSPQAQSAAPPAQSGSAPNKAASLPATPPVAGAPFKAVHGNGDRHEEPVPMSPMRQRIAQRLVEANQNAALLTTFNEIDMGAVLALRQEYQEAFTQKYNIKLGFMSFFVKAAVDALKLIPQINAEIRELPGSDGQPVPHIVYRNYYDIGVAVGGGKGLVVPMIRNAERLSFAEIELAIADFGKRAKENKISLDELIGGTFTISNGGIYGSLLSTPIINPPQSGILGLHAIQDRPVARNGQVVIRPMMYVALTYDHRIVDGREAVTFLKRIKEAVEQPARMLLEV